MALNLEGAKSHEEDGIGLGKKTYTFPEQNVYVFYHQGSGLTTERDGCVLCAKLLREDLGALCWWRNISFSVGCKVLNG